MRKIAALIVAASASLLFAPSAGAACTATQQGGGSDLPIYADGSPEEGTGYVGGESELGWIEVSREADGKVQVAGSNSDGSIQGRADVGDPDEETGTGGCLSLLDEA